MAVIASNANKHKIGYFFEQARDTAADIGCLLLISAGLQPDDTLADHDTVASLLAASNDEATFTNYARKILPAAVVTQNNVNNTVSLTITGTPPVQITWNNAGTGNTLAKIVFYYDPTPGSSLDTALRFLCAADISFITDGSHLVITLGTNGIVVVS